MSHIEICGGIASGKTTFSMLLEKFRINTILENFEVNPFWKTFYSNPTQYAFETEITFLLQHYHQIKLSSSHTNNWVCDFSLILDLAYADVTLQGSKKDSFLSVYNEVIKELPTPTLIIHLLCEPKTELERIRKRGRSVENTITIEFLDLLNLAIKRRVSEMNNKVNIINIDSEKLDFANNEQAQQEVLNLVRSSIPI
jgi:deoxyadenosine/deoxycytidine kinase